MKKKLLSLVSILLSFFLILSIHVDAASSTTKKNTTTKTSAPTAKLPVMSIHYPDVLINTNYINLDLIMEKFRADEIKQIKVDNKLLKRNVDYGFIPDTGFFVIGTVLKPGSTIYITFNNGKKYTAKLEMEKVLKKVRETAYIKIIEPGPETELVVGNTVIRNSFVSVNLYREELRKIKTIKINNVMLKEKTDYVYDGSEVIIFGSSLKPGSILEITDVAGVTYKAILSDIDFIKISKPDKNFNSNYVKINTATSDLFMTFGMIAEVKIDGQTLIENEEYKYVDGYIYIFGSKVKSDSIIEFKDSEGNYIKAQLK